MNLIAWRQQRFPFPISEALLVIALGIASLCLYQINLGGVTLRDWDEGTYGIIAREMVRTGDWLHPRQFGNPFYDKPPLVFWLIALSYSLGGINEWTTRLPLAGFSALAIPLLYLVGRQLGERRPALLAALVYLTLLPIVRHNRLAMLDGLAITWFLGLLWCYLKGRRQPVWLLGVGISFAGILLSKGILALLMGAVVLVFILWERDLKIFRQPYLWLGFLVGNVPVWLWYLAQVELYGPEFWSIHFLNLSLNRAWEHVDQHRGPLWYYVQEIFKLSWPWLVFLPAGLRLCWQQRHTSWGKLTLVGVIALFIPITLMRTKLPWYILPVYPFFALAIGLELHQIWQGLGKFARNAKPARINAYRFYVAFLMVLSIFGVAAGIIYGLNRDFWVCSIGILIGLTSGGAAYLLWQKHRYFILWLVAGLYLGLGVFFCSPVWVWELNETFSVKPVAQLIQTQVPQGSAIYTTFAYGRPSLNFYADRPITAIQSDQFLELFRTKQYLLVDPQILASLDPKTHQNLGTASELTLVRAK
jgi:4-amino-4-deoxy-L-arabinose transferase-like glycosyltransferase